MVQKITGITLLILSAFITSKIILDNNITNLNNCVSLTPAQQFKQMVEKDFFLLEKAQKLPPQWMNINKVNIRISSQLALYILGDSVLDFGVKQNGSHYIDLDVLDVPDDKNPAILIQASLFHQKTKNKIFEIGRTYKSEDLNMKSK